MKELPIGMQTFRDLIEGGYVYADKTKYVYDLARKGKAYFLSRPRRFGKSLLLSTFEALFSGPPDPDGPPQGFFKDLWIGRESDYDFSQTHPVISLSMSSSTNSSDDLQESILKKLRRINDSEKLGLDITLPGTDLHFVIQGLKEKYGEKVVVLIDEYDAPVSNNIDNLKLAQKNSEILRDFYSGFKDTDKYLRFVFVTGVTRYVFMGLSAGLNQLYDLTLDEKFSNICGFTHDELKVCFADYFPNAFQELKRKNVLEPDATVTGLQKKILHWYDGYSWDGETMVLNPFSLINFFQSSKFIPFWMNQDPSAKLITALLAKNPFAFTEDKLRELTEKQVGVAEVGTMEPVPTLFQTGYLTVDRITYAANGSPLYHFRLPNEEIKPEFLDKFANALKKYFKKDPEAKKDIFRDIVEYGYADRLSELINSIYASIPARHHRSVESYYHSVLFGYLYDMPDTVITLPEQPGSIGTPDLVIIFDDGLHVVIELKYERKIESRSKERTVGAKLEKKHEPTEAEITGLLIKLAKGALRAIETKHYLQPYLARSKRVIKIGLGICDRGQSLAVIENQD
ncbi:MAG: ATP-binding protein [Deltaproteobacteria bacterium]|jgi:hypothetical protein|nr:ATP-binding protein [Deltaproteobacteria bacterium]